MRDELKGFIEAQILSGRAVAPEEDLLVSGLVDSLGVMRLVAFIENAFGLKVPARDLTLKNFRSVDAIAAYVAAKEEA